MTPFIGPDANCNCLHWDSVPVVRLCEPHHKYHIGGKELASVSSVVRSIIPTDYSAVNPEILENARHRGIAVDEVLSAYINDELTEIPSGIREDSSAMLERLIPWFVKQGFAGAEAQVCVNDDEVAGTIDIITDDWILDLKTVSSLQPSYGLQLGGYYDLASGSGRRKYRLGVIHMRKDFRVPKLVEYDAAECLDRWTIVRDCWQLKRELTDGPR